MVGVTCSDAHSSIASFSIISNPSHNCIVGGGASLGAALFFFFR